MAECQGNVNSPTLSCAHCVALLHRWRELGPRGVVAPDSAPKQLQQLEEKIQNCAREESLQRGTASIVSVMQSQSNLELRADEITSCNTRAFNNTENVNSPLTH
jgi:hypothetical protein